MHTDEIAARMTAMWANPVGERLSIEEEKALLNLGAASESLPKSVDWSTTRNPLGKPIITPPQNQGHCGKSPGPVKDLTFYQSHDKSLR